MAKRKLTRRQAWRIDKIQQERSERAARRDQQIEQQLQGGELGPEQQGLIISHFGKQVDVEARQGPLQGTIIRCHLRTHLGQLVTGDQVIWRAGVTHGVVVAVLPRRSELIRPSNQGELKPVAANIDQIIITFAAEPLAHANLIDRYLVAAELSQIRPLLLLNKADLIDASNQQTLHQLCERYRTIGYTVLTASTTAKHGLEQLQEALAGHINVFVGQSGVGKSSLINALLPGVSLKTAALSEQSRKGRHTTTTARLFHFPHGGDLIDSPGIREFALWHIAPENLMAGFIELAPYAGHCKFRDCSHEHEPGCAILQAVAEGAISQARLDSYQRIRATLQHPSVG